MVHFLVTLLSALPFAGALELPSIHAKVSSSAIPASSTWWAQVGDRVFYAPPTSLLGLSQNVSDYYYVMGSKAALTDAMKEHVVGSQGRWHIMHLPKGPSMLQMSEASRSGSRRSSLSAFQRLKSGTKLSEGFPLYELSADYQYPLDDDGATMEKAAMAFITPESIMDYLTQLTEFPTRSYQNVEESHKVESFLKQQFEDMSLGTCFLNFKSGERELTNVVAHIPGTSSDSVTIGAHYDSRPFEGSAPGAEDNGSGVAALLAIAKALKSSEIKPKKTVYLVAFAGEEPGMLGSKNFASALKSESLPPECTFAKGANLLQKQRTQKRQVTKSHAVHRAIIMDEIGWPSPKLSEHTVNLESYTSLGHNVMEHLRHSSADHNGDSLVVVHNAAPFGSDHMSFLDLGLEGVLTINGDDEAYPNYHQSTDTIQNVNGDFMTKIAKMNLGGLLRMAMM